MPGDAVNILADTRVTQFGNCAAPEIVVMVKNPNFRVDRGPFKGRAEMKLYEFNFILLAPQRGRHSSILVRVNFILNCYGVDFYAFTRIALQEFHEIVGVRGVILFAHRPAKHRATGFHPTWRAPRRGKEK